MYEEEIHFRNCYLNCFGRFDPGDLDLWSSVPIINRASLLPRMDEWTKFEEWKSGRVIDRKRLGTFDHGDLDLWPSDPKSIGFLCCPVRMCGPSLRKVGQGFLELLIRNKKVTDGQSNRHVQSNMPSLLRGGHN